MSQYLAKIEKLAAAVGLSTNSSEIVQLLILQNNINDLLTNNGSRSQLIKILEEDLEKIKIARRAEKELFDRADAECREDIEKFRQKNIILHQYVETLDSNDFILNKLRQEINKKQEQTYIELKAIIEKARSIAGEVAKLDQMQKEADELRQKAGQ
jgi:predicted RNase H-like nuclease (RuvC/YqgF family)